MSPHNEAARKLLSGMREDDDAKTAQEARRILSTLKLPADQKLEMWTRRLSHADGKVRSEAISALGNLAASAKPAKPALQERFTKENNDECKAAILYALTAIDPDDPALVPFLITSMDTSESWVRWSAMRCLEALGPKAKDALPTIEARLFKPGKKGKAGVLDDGDTRKLVDVIVRLAPGSAKSTAILLKALRHPDIRAMHCPKNTWYMRDVLEDHLQANLPAAAHVLREAL